METNTYVEKNNFPTEVPFHVPREAAGALSALTPAAPMDWPVERFTQALGRREDNRRALLQWVAANLKQGVDFGRIHVFGKDKCPLAREGRSYECDNPRHWSKPSLWKPGAEKICGMLALIPRFPNLREYENAAINGTEIKVILLKCELHTSNGFVAAEGTGARMLAQDSGDINKALKMAEKSAHIDATLRVAGLSEIFTQDIEDMIQDAGSAPGIQPDTSSLAPAHQQATGNQPRFQARAQQNPPAGNGAGFNQPCEGKASQANGGSTAGNRITGKQFKFIMDLIAEAKMTKEDLNKQCIEAYGVVVDHLSRSEASGLIDWLRRQ